MSSVQVQQKINNQISYIKLLKTMRRMDHLAMKDILKKRQVRTANPSLYEQELLQPTLLSTHKQITIDSIIQKIQKNANKTSHQTELNTEQKYVIIEFMSERQNISYNRNTLINLMHILVCYNAIWAPYHPPPTRPRERQKNNFIKKPFKNFFILSGQIAVYDAPPQDLNKASLNQMEQTTFETQSKPLPIEAQLQGVQPRTILEEHSGWGPLFRKKQEELENCIMKITNAVIIGVEQPEIESMLVNLGGMDQQKKYKILQHFPIFSNISKKMISILPYIGLKKYSKSQYIYKLKQSADAVYLILKGEIVFEVRVELPKQKKSTALNKNHINQIVFQTQALGMGNYFGEQEILLKTTRQANTICNSAECDLLQIPIDKFEKLLAYSDFFQQLKLAADAKFEKRKQKLEKSMIIHQQFSKSPEKNMDQSADVEERKTATIESKKISVRKKSTQPVRVMHGNVIRKIHNKNNTEQINFSMLGANPDMYEATLKKFRKYTMKPPQKYKPEVNWNLKRVWKVLNLESILRQDAEVTSPEGRKFYESHRRLQNHVQQVKSLRPKTSSSTYRTKLQYIAYLQQFNN